MEILLISKAVSVAEDRNTPSCEFGVTELAVSRRSMLA
jgi:hypothetical protein